MSFKASLRFVTEMDELEVELRVLPRKGDLVRHAGLNPDYIHHVTHVRHTFVPDGQEVEIFLARTSRHS